MKQRLLKFFSKPVPEKGNLTGSVLLRFFKVGVALIVLFRPAADVLKKDNILSGTIIERTLFAGDVFMRDEFVIKISSVAR
jgi:hypothetical protein